MYDADAPHPRRRAIDQLTILIAQAEKAVARYQLARQQQSQSEGDLGPLRALLRMAEERVALLRQSRDRVLADTQPAPRRTRRSSLRDASS